MEEYIGNIEGNAQKQNSKQNHLRGTERARDRKNMHLVGYYTTILREKKLGDEFLVGQLKNMILEWSNVD